MSTDEVEHAKKENKPLKGIRGWLRFYLVGPTIIGYTFGVASLIFFDAAPIALFVGLAGVFSVWTLFQTGQPWVKGFHILQNAFWGVMALITEDWGGAIGAAIWIWYWAVSKRVMSTYAIAQDDAAKTSGDQQRPNTEQD